LSSVGRYGVVVIGDDRRPFTVADLTEPELRQEILKLRQRVEKLAALLRLALALLRVSGFRLSTRLPEGKPSCGS
jgi:hypothetical protein